MPWVGVTVGREQLPLSSHLFIYLFLVFSFAVASLQVFTSSGPKKSSPTPFPSSCPSRNSRREGMKMWRSAAADAFTRTRPPLAWRTPSQSSGVHQSWRCGRAASQQQQLFPPSLKSLDGSVGVRRRRQSCTGTQEEGEVRRHSQTPDKEFEAN